MRDDLGYCSALRDGKWVVQDRYANIVENEGSFASDAEAQRRADDLNALVIKRRLHA